MTAVRSCDRVSAHRLEEDHLAAALDQWCGSGSLAHVRADTLVETMFVGGMRRAVRYAPGVAHRGMVRSAKGRALIRVHRRRTKSVAPLREGSGEDVDWSKLSSTTRLRRSQLSFLRDEDEDRRSPFERDYERVVFSSAFRRLQDKTQAFPIEPSDYVRTRLTHSVEVAALGRSLASTAMRNLLDKHLERSVNPEDAAFIVATACLLHDLGNPPFGHSGEAAIQEWFAEHRSAFEFGDAQERQDFERFEGNALGFRLATRLQHLGDHSGLNLTAGTLAAFLKYPCGSHEVTSNGKSRSKFGYFKADTRTFERVHDEVQFRFRHPLAFLMEAADDIANCFVDVEDALKKRVLSLPQMIERLRTGMAGSLAEAIVESALVARLEVLERAGLVGGDRDQLAYQYFRQVAMGKMAASAARAFVDHYDGIRTGEFDTELVEVMDLARLNTALRALAKEFVHANPNVVTLEHRGRHVIRELLNALVPRRDKPGTKLFRALVPPTPAHPDDANVACSDDYRRALAAVDFIAGMTDTYAEDLFRRLSGAHNPRI